MGCPPTTVCEVLNISAQRNEKVKKKSHNFSRNKNAGGGKEEENTLFLFIFRNSISVPTFFFNLQLMLAIRMKQHLDLKTLQLCHLEKVKQFSKHFCPICFSN